MLQNAHLVNNGQIDDNLKARHSKGVGIVNQIMSLLKEVSFGPYYFQMALMFRNSQLINGTLYNMEALHGVRNNHLDIIEECDKMLSRQSFDCQQEVEAFFFETSTIATLGPEERPILSQRDRRMGRRVVLYSSVTQPASHPASQPASRTA